MNSRDFLTSEENGQFKAKQNGHYWIVDKGSTLITGHCDGREVLEFASKPIKNKSALVDWVLRVFYV